MKLVIISISLLLIISMVHRTLAQTNAKECTTPDLKPGSCVPLRDCQFVLDLLEWLQKQFFGTFRNEENLRNYLSRSQCGYDENHKKPLVCCQSWKTSNRATTTPTPPIAAQADQMFDPIVDDNRKAFKDLKNHPNIDLINGPNCGLVTTDRIIHGNRTELFELPWMALLQYQTDDGLKFLCGGTLISRRYVLTAAHCLTHDRDAKLVSVRLGEHDLATAQDCVEFDDERVCAAPPQDIRVERATIHRDFEKTTLGDDIALLRLAEEANLADDNVRTICLPDTKEIQARSFDKMLVSGWGITETGKSSDILLKAAVPVLGDDQCFDTLKQQVNRRFLSPIQSDQFCAGGSDSDSDRGDSGGPLQAITLLSATKSRYVQYGIVSYGYKVLSGNILPTIFTHVGSHMQWILDNMS